MQEERLIPCRSGQDLPGTSCATSIRTMTSALAAMDKLKYWMPVDWYNGGMEHVDPDM